MQSRQFALPNAHPDITLRPTSPSSWVVDVGPASGSSLTISIVLPSSLGVDASVPRTAPTLQPQATDSPMLAPRPVYATPSFGVNFPWPAELPDVRRALPLQEVHDQSPPYEPWSPLWRPRRLDLPSILRPASPESEPVHPPHPLSLSPGRPESAIQPQPDSSSSTIDAPIGASTHAIVALSTGDDLRTPTPSEHLGELIYPSPAAGSTPLPDAALSPVHAVEEQFGETSAGGMGGSASDKYGEDVSCEITTRDGGPLRSPRREGKHWNSLPVRYRRPRAGISAREMKGILDVTLGPRFFTSDSVRRAA